MPVLVKWIMSALASLVGMSLAPIICRFLFLVGFSVVSYLGISTLTDYAVDIFNDQLANLPPQVYQVVGLLGLDQAASIIFGAAATKLALTSVNGAKTSTSFLPQDCNF
jgi:hypothetical protein